MATIFDTGIKRIDKEEISKSEIGLSDNEIEELKDVLFKSYAEDDDEIDGHFIANDDFIMMK